MRRILGCALGVAVAGVMGCRSGDDLTMPSTDDPPVAAGLTPSPPSVPPPDVLLSALSTALADQQVQVDVRAAMRSSPYLHHRVELGVLLGSKRGRRLARSIGRALEIPASRVVRQVQAAAPVDLLVLTREDRLHWRGGGEVVLAWMPTLKRWELARPFVQGEERSPSQIGPKPGTEDVVFALEPARAKLRRVSPQPEGIGNVIQDANDGEYVVLLRRSITDGQGVMQFSECEEILPECGGGGGGGGSGLTYMDSFCWTFGDDPLGVGDVEIQFRARPMGGGDVWDRLYGGLVAGQPVPNQRCLVPNEPYVAWEPSAPGEFLVVEMWELDTWPLHDDNKGRATWSFGQSGEVINYYSNLTTLSGSARHSW